MSKILLIAPQPFFCNRGTPMNVRAMASCITALGHELDLLCFPFGEDVQIPRMNLIRCPKIPGIKGVPIGPSMRKIAYDGVLSLHAIGKLRKERYSLIHGIEEGGLIAGFLGGLFRVPFIVDLDSCMESQLRDSKLGKVPGLLWMLRTLERKYLNQANAVIAVCRSLAERSRAIAPNSPVFQIEDFPLESARTVDVNVIRRFRAKGEISSRKVIVYTGNLEAYQGIDLLMDAFAALMKKISGKRPLLLFVGGDEAKVAKYKARALELGLQDDVLFEGARPENEMGAYMELADVLVSPRALGDNVPLKIYTYMAAGKAIVATRIASHTQVLTDESAFLCEPNAHSLAEGMRSALEDNTKRERLGVNARELAESRYSEREFRRKMGEVYEFLLGTTSVQQKRRMPSIVDEKEASVKTR